MDGHGRRAALAVALAAAGLAVPCSVALGDSGGVAPGSSGSGSTTTTSTTTTTPKPAPKPKPKPKPKPRPRFPIWKEQDLTGVLITQYWSVPERWFVGAKVVAPGLSKPHRADFLYSASGVAMEGDGIGLDGRHLHWEYGGNWIGKSQGLAGWPPYWLSEGFWWTKAPAGKRKVTFRLESGGWSNGKGAIAVPPRQVRFGEGPSRYLKPWGSIAVDPRVIPFGSAVKIPYRRGWFCAHDTGGAIKGRHIDVYRPAPATREGGNTVYNGKLHVLPPAVAKAKIKRWKCVH